MASSCYAKNLAYENWINNDKGFSLDGTEYKVLVAEQGNSVLLRSETETKSVNLRDCLVFDYKEICLNESAYLSQEKDYKVHIYVYYLEPKITLSFSADTSNPLIGEEVEFIATLKNAGDVDTYVTFSGDLPENLELTSATEGDVSHKSVVWKGLIKQGESKKIRYRAKANGELDRYVKSSISYFDGFQNKDTFSDAVRIYTDSIFSFELISNKDKYEIGEEAVFTARLKNKGEKTLTVDHLTFVFSGDATIEDTQKTYHNEFTWKGTIEESEYENITFRLTPDLGQVYLVSATGQYTYDGEKYSISSTTRDIETENKGILINATIVPSTVKSGEKFTAIVKLTNTNSFLKIQKARLGIKTDVANIENTSHGVILPNETVLLLNNEIIAPATETDKEYPIRFNVTYTAENGEIYSDTLEKTLKVISEKKLLLTSAISAGSIAEDESFTVTISIKNPGQDKIIDAHVKAIIPAGITIKGPTSGYVSLAPEEEVTLLSFTAYPSIVMQETDYLLNFTVEYTLNKKEFKISSEKNLLVTPRKPKLSVSKAFSESTAFQGQIIDVTYTITNDDNQALYNILIDAPNDQELDTLNKFNIRIEKLSPGEKIVLKGEQIRTKKTGTYGSISTAFFDDKLGRRFNSSSNAPQVTVSESKINGPAAYIVQGINSDNAKVNEDVFVVINITNIGTSALIGTLAGLGEVEIAPGKEQSFQEKLSMGKEGTFIIPKKTFYYDFSMNKARAYSNQVEIAIANNTEGIKTENKDDKKTPTAKAEKTGIETTKATSEKEKPKKGFFAGIMSWFAGLFKKI